MSETDPSQCSGGKTGLTSKHVSANVSFKLFCSKISMNVLILGI